MHNVWEGIVDWRNRAGPKPELTGGLGAKVAEEVELS